jgi:hypothetical protein
MFSLKKNFDNRKVMIFFSNGMGGGSISPFVVYSPDGWSAVFALFAQIQLS